MEPRIKEWIDLYSKIAESVSDLVIILDSSFEILHVNQKAARTFYIDEFSLTIEQVFTNDSARQLTDEIGTAVFTNQKKIIKDFSVTVNTGENFVYDLIISPVDTDGEKLILLFFSRENFRNQEFFADNIRMKIGRRFFEEENKSIKSLLDEIEKLIPFTLVGLKRLQVIIDGYNFPVWIKDLQKKFIAINKSYSEILGIETSLAPGKRQELFLPAHLVSVYNSLDDYILNTANPIVLEGIGKKVNDSQVNQNTFLIPLLDKRNKLYAVIGLINDEKITKNAGNIFSEFAEGFVEQFPRAAALLNFNGKIEQANQIFCKFLNKEWENIISKNYIDLFPYLFSENIKSFTESELNSDEIFLGDDLNPVDYLNSSVTANLLKISVKDSTAKKIIIILDEPKKLKQDENDLQTIIQNRGKMFDILIQNNPEPIFIYDKENLKFLEVNDAAIRFYGFSRDEFLQMDLTDLYAPEDIQTLLNSFGDESTEGKFSKPFRHRKKDGSVVVVEISKTSFRFNDREAHFNIVKDITSSIEKDKQNQMLKVIFNSTDSLVFTTDSSGFITFINYPVIEKLGYTSDELIKSSFASLVIDEDRGIVNTSIFQSQIRDEVSLETKIKMHNGDLLDAEITASPILDFNNEVESFTIIVKPAKYLVTTEPPKEIIKEVIKEVVVEKIVPDSSQVKPNIPDANFISGVFHEILTPMNVIIGFAQELVSGIENPTEEQREAADIINQNRVKMMDTMNAVAEYSDILQNKSTIKIENIPITEIVDVLDKNIKDISGLNDIHFGYGKISSSLIFSSDKQKFESLIFYLIKVISRLSKDKKVYFSAYPIDSDSFFIGLSDQYGSTSDYVSNTFDKIFNEDKDPKDFGLPKLTSYLTKTLLSMLDGKYYKSVVGAMRQEAGFLFPLNLPIKETNIYNPPTYESITPEQSKEENIEESFSKTEKKFEGTPSIPLQTEVKHSEELQDLDESITEELQEESSKVEQEEDIFKPVTPIAEELLSKMEEEQLQAESNSELIEPEVQESFKEEVIPQAALEEEPETPEVFIPEVKDETEKLFVPPKPQLNLSDLSCLYIEDQVDSQILFKVQMKGLKEIKFAVSFEESQPLLLNSQFDFIVMDINLQGEYNGLDALKIIKTMPALSNIPVIAVTAYVLPGDKEKFIAAGFDDFISKPIFREKMMESLEKIFLSKY